jgi:hypothetical protein
MSSNTLEIIQGLAQAAANAYDGSHDERFMRDGEAKKVGLRREEGCPIMDSRVMDGFKVKFSGDSICINYQSDIRLKEVYGGKFEADITRMLNEIKKFLQKEYKAITGKSITLKADKDSEPSILVQSTSNVRSFVNAYQWFKISKIDSEPILNPSEDRTDKAIRDFLALHSTKRPKNDKRKKNDNKKK